LFTENINADLYYKKDYDASDFSVEEDDKLIKKDKNPNSKGAENLGIKELSDGEKVIKDSDLIVVWGEGLERYISDLSILKEKKVVYIGAFVDKIQDYSDYVIPSLIFAEKSGSFTNFEGKIQNFKKAVKGPDNAKPEWEIFAGILHGFDSSVNYSTVEQVFGELNAK
jgi:NADH dehydrogenase/NADH:ubiquinone oxidoreductase subunit G